MSELARKILAERNLCMSCGGEPMSYVHSRDSVTLAEALTAAQQRVKELEHWKEAIDEALMVSCIGTCESFSSAKEALNALLAWESAVALDPAVSEPMRAITAENAKLRELLTEAYIWLELDGKAIDLIHRIKAALEPTHDA